MAGVEIVAQPMNKFDYGTLAAGSTITLSPVILAEIDVSQWREGTLEVIINDATVPTGASFTFNVYAIVRTQAAPITRFTDTSQPVATVTVNATVSSAKLSRASFSSNFGGMIAVALTPAVSSAGTGSFNITCQVNLSLKS